jgi:hypothetical protein
MHLLISFLKIILNSFVTLVPEGALYAHLRGDP